MLIRENMELLERTYLSPFATLSENSKGRDREEPHVTSVQFSKGTGIGSSIVNHSEGLGIRPRYF